jgi:hypothetical protein
VSAQGVEAFSATELLAAWDQASDRPPLARTALLLGWYVGTSAERAARLPIGRRDELLFELRTALFGAKLRSLTSCARCGELLEFDLDARSICERPAGEIDEALLIESDGYQLNFRLPTTNDLAALSRAADLRESRTMLLRRCIANARVGEADLPFEQLPEHILNAVVEAMAKADPLADVQIGLVCNHCQHSWSAVFDIVSFLWTELDAWARQTLQEIHVLASAYGWSESQILELRPGKRQLYLKLISA